MKQMRIVETVDTAWQSLYKMAGITALVLLAYSLATMIIMVLTGGQPATVDETFAILRENRIVGLLRLDLLTVFCMPLYYILFMALFIALRRTSLSGAVVATVLTFAGLTLFLATPSVFSYLFLSDQYLVAAESQRASILSAGQAILASDMWHGSGALVGGLLLQTGATWISAVMLRGTVFGKGVAYVGILAHGLDLARILINFLAPGSGDILMTVAGPLYLVWFPMVAVRLFQLGRPIKSAHSQFTQVVIEGE